MLVAMCGRYTLTIDAALIFEELDLVATPDLVAPRYNIAPGQMAAVVADDQPDRLQLRRWGLVPSWAEDPKIGQRLINARSETATVKPAFRAAFRRRRCLVPADGFYEWRKVGARKVPIYIRLASPGVMTFAGLWDRWQGKDGVEITSFAILTTAACPTVAPIHHRMPAVLPTAARIPWLDPATEVPRLQDLLIPFSDGALETYEVSTLVNTPKNDEPRCIEPAVAGADTSDGPLQLAFDRD